jgi:hypothetical protein
MIECSLVIGQRETVLLVRHWGATLWIGAQGADFSLGFNFFQYIPQLEKYTPGFSPKVE